jgi:hypothetical protein
MPTSADRRHAARYELIAQANVVSGDEAYLLPVRNLSMTGAFLEGSPAEHPDLKPGVELEVTVSASDAAMGDEDVINVRCKGRVARVEPARLPSVGGFGITMEPATKEDAERLHALLGRLTPAPPSRPPALRA